MKNKRYLELEGDVVPFDNSLVGGQDHRQRTTDRPGLQAGARPGAHTGV
jgi:hypothetical protein